MKRRRGRWILSKFYAVDIEHRLIYDTPLKTGELQVPEHVLPGANWAMNNGRLLTFLRLEEKGYRIIHSGEVPKTCCVCGTIYPVPESLDGLDPSEYVCRKSCADKATESV